MLGMIYSHMCIRCPGKLRMREALVSGPSICAGGNPLRPRCCRSWNGVRRHIDHRLWSPGANGVEA